MKFYNPVLGWPTFALASAAIMAQSEATSSHPTPSPTDITDRYLDPGHHPIQAQGGDTFPFP